MRLHPSLDLDRPRPHHEATYVARQLEHTIMRVRRSLPTVQIAGPGKARLKRSLADVLAVSFLIGVVIVASVLGSSSSVLGSEPLPAEKIAVASVSASVRSHAIEPARHHCRCGTNCGGSCCCNGRGSGRAATIDGSGVLPPSTGATDGVFGQTGQAPVEHPRPGRHPLDLSVTHQDTGPCMSRLPCGGGTIPPSSSPLTRSLDSALLPGRHFVTFHRAVEKLSLTPAACLAKSGSEPLDKPPRAMNGF
jgi:hypothetical protein